MFYMIGLFIDPLKCFTNSGTYLVGNLAFLIVLCVSSQHLGVIKTYVGETSWSEIEDFLWLTFSAVHVTIISISIDRFFMVVPVTSVTTPLLDERKNYGNMASLYLARGCNLSGENTGLWKWKIPQACWYLFWAYSDPVFSCYLWCNVF